jgi:uncharacterized Zn finger protein
MTKTPQSRSRSGKDRVLIQTLLPEEIASWVRDRADASGLTASAFLRLVLTKVKSKRMKFAA